MPRKASADVASRRRALLGLLASAEEGLSLAEMEQGLPGQTARRTLHEDLAYFKMAFPGRLQRVGAGDAHGASRVAYRWTGSLPHLLNDGLTWITDEELLALVAARGLLHHEDRSLAATAGAASSLQGLSSAIHGLIVRAQLTEVAGHQGRHVVAVSRFGAAPVAPQTLSTCLAATASSQGLRFIYTNLEGVTDKRIVAPQRLVLIRGEWYLVAWEGILRMFRLSRITGSIERVRPPKDTPIITSRNIDELLDESFFATGSMDRRKRCRVVLAISPGSWPFIEGRTWGLNQRIDAEPSDLPAGWRRLSFTTTGLNECRHWVLGQGLGLKAEAPQELVDWLRQETASLASLYAK